MKNNKLLFFQISKFWYGLLKLGVERYQSFMIIDQYIVFERVALDFCLAILRTATKASFTLVSENFKGAGDFTEQQANSNFLVIKPSSNFY